MHRMLRGLQYNRIACGDGGNQWTDAQIYWEIPWGNNQYIALGLIFDFGGRAYKSEFCRHRLISHPIF